MSRALWPALLLASAAATPEAWPHPDPEPEPRNPDPEPPYDINESGPVRPVAGTPRHNPAKQDAAQAKRERRRARNLRRGEAHPLILVFGAICSLVGLACCVAALVLDGATNLSEASRADGTNAACSAHCRHEGHDAGVFRDEHCVCSDEVEAPTRPEAP